MNLLYRQNQGRAGNKIKKSVWDCNNSRVSPLEAIVERKLFLLWKYNDFLLQISKKKYRQVSVKENGICSAGGGTLRYPSCLCSLCFSVSVSLSLFLRLQIKTIQLKASVLNWSGHICISYLEESTFGCLLKERVFKRTIIHSLLFLPCTGVFIWGKLHHWGV